MLLQCVCLWKVFWRTETTVESLQDEIAWAICITFSWEKILFLRHKTHGKKRRVRIFQTCCGKEDFVFKIVCLKLSAIIFFLYHHSLISDVVLLSSFPDHSATDRLTISGQHQQNPFSLLLKNMKTALRVGPKSTLDIPVSFAPTEMKKYEALCTVVVTKEEGTPWEFVPKDDRGWADNLAFFGFLLFRSLTPPQTLCRPLSPPILEV